MTNSENSLVNLKPFSGWLLDVYPSDLGEMTVWVIKKTGERAKLTDQFQPRIYVSGSLSKLSSLTEHLATSRSVASWRYVEKYVDCMTDTRSRVLEITTRDCRWILSFARRLLRLGGYEELRLHNVDIPDGQAYFYAKDIFPLAQLAVTDQGNRLAYWLLDSVKSVDYTIPPLRRLSLRVQVATERVIPTFHDPIGSIILEGSGEESLIDDGDEAEKILSMVQVIRAKDPDIIFTRGGDSFLFPYLAYRALVNAIPNELVLGREAVPLRAQKQRGTTFFSYGRVYFKAPTRRLYGRIHIDEGNTFIYSACGLDGLMEVARACRVPLQRAARASIGTIMSSLQLYQATKDDILIPWKKREPESFKSAWELLVADRGGFIFEPQLGIHDWVAEVDFSSMYPTLMAKRNISAETVLCTCCAGSNLRVPELGYHICEKREGIVPRTLKMILEKRAIYKRLQNEAEDPELKQLYTRRQNALKWILVTCFGYLGYRNARFGKVDAHIAVCAFAREALLKTVHMAEARGFAVVHGIVDSLWLKKEGASPREYAEVCQAIAKEIGVPLNVEGRYRWIVFLPSRMHRDVPVLNRYYGVFETGRIKVRGIEAVRRDTPPFLKRAQMDMIKVLAKAPNSTAFRKRISEAVDVLRSYVQKLRSRDVDVQELVIAKQLSKQPDSYRHNVLQAIAAQQLKKMGIAFSGGQIIKYVITDAKNKKPNKRVKAARLINAETDFDAEKYVDMLLLTGANTLSPFGYTENTLRDEIVYGEKQTVLTTASPTLHTYHSCLEKRHTHELVRP